MALFDPVYKQLADEKLAGWQSEAVGALWKSRTRKFKLQASGNRTEDSKKFTPEDSKYFKFYNDVLAQLAPGVFVNNGKEETFIDIGSAPGGLSRFLITVCGWRGYAFSLSPAEGGLQMKYSNIQKLRFSMANMTKENEWKRVLSLADTAGYDQVSFVNLGVVVDFGQVESDNGNSATMASRAINASVSQFLILLNLLKENGSGMWIHSLSHLDSFFFFLQYIVEVFDTVRIINTLAPARSPVYVLMTGFRKHNPLVEKFKNVLMRDGSVVSPDTISKWQIDDFSVIENVMKSHPSVTADIHLIWDQKRESLAESRLFAEKRFGRGLDQAGNLPEMSQSASAASRSPAVFSETDDARTDRRARERPTASTVCSVSSSEVVHADTGLLSLPKTFRPHGRKRDL